MYLSYRKMYEKDTSNSHCFHTTQIYTSLQDVTLIQSNSTVLYILHVLSTFKTSTKSSVILPVVSPRHQGLRHQTMMMDQLRNLELEQMECICCSDTYRFISSSCRNNIKNGIKWSSFCISDPLKSQQAGFHSGGMTLNGCRAFFNLN